MVTLDAAALHLAALVQSSDDAIVSKDLDGIVQSWNPAAERLFGYTAAEMIGRSIRAIIPADRQGEEDEVLRSIRQGERVEHFETVRCHKDGSTVDISLTVSPIRAPDGTIVGASKIARDIREHKRLIRQLEEHSRLKDEFLATLSHELRTPLNAIMGYVRMLRSGTIKSEGRARALDLVDRNAHALARMVNDVLDMSTIVAGRTRLAMQTCDLVAVVQASVEVVRQTAQAKQQDLQLDARGTVFVLGDPDRLQQVFWNILVNATKFTPAGGRISARVLGGDTHAVVSIADTGAGIPAEFLPHVFERFRQGDTGTTREFGGLGLGLALVRHYVELHGGSVSAASPGPGLGTTFEVTLPLHAAAPQRTR
jgi:PAS domain S-box-containing protein